MDDNRSVKFISVINFIGWICAYYDDGCPVEFFDATCKAKAPRGFWKPIHGEISDRYTCSIAFYLCLTVHYMKAPVAYLLIWGLSVFCFLTRIYCFRELAQILREGCFSRLGNVECGNLQLLQFSVEKSTSKASSHRIARIFFIDKCATTNNLT